MRCQTELFSLPFLACLLLILGNMLLFSHVSHTSDRTSAIVLQAWRITPCAYMNVTMYLTILSFGQIRITQSLATIFFAHQFDLGFSKANIALQKIYLSKLYLKRPQSAIYLKLLD